jgi:transcriptional regulator with XRE-family HTH domain
VVRLTREQCRAARGLLDWPQVRLGAKSNVSEGTVRDFENGKRVPTVDKLIAMQSAWKRQASPSWAMARHRRADQELGSGSHLPRGRSFEMVKPASSTTAKCKDPATRDRLHRAC